MLLTPKSEISSGCFDRSRWKRREKLPDENLTLTSISPLLTKELPVDEDGYDDTAPHASSFFNAKQKKEEELQQLRQAQEQTQKDRAAWKEKLSLERSPAKAAGNGARPAALDAAQ